MAVARLLSVEVQLAVAWTLRRAAALLARRCHSARACLGDIIGPVHIDDGLGDSRQILLLMKPAGIRIFLLEDCRSNGGGCDSQARVGHIEVSR